MEKLSVKTLNPNNRNFDFFFLILKQFQMPKNKKVRSPVATPESPRKTPKKNEFSSPRKVDPAGQNTRQRNGQSPSPIRRLKIFFGFFNFDFFFIFLKFIFL